MRELPLARVLCLVLVFFAVSRSSVSSSTPPSSSTASQALALQQQWYQSALIVDTTLPPVPQLSVPEFQESLLSGVRLECPPASQNVPLNYTLGQALNFVPGVASILPRLVNSDGSFFSNPSSPSSRETYLVFNVSIISPNCTCLYKCIPNTFRHDNPTVSTGAVGLGGFAVPLSGLCGRFQLCTLCGAVTLSDFEEVTLSISVPFTQGGSCNYTLRAFYGAPAQVMIDSFPGVLRVGAPMSPPVNVLILDSFGNFVLNHIPIAVTLKAGKGRILGVSTVTTTTHFASFPNIALAGPANVVQFPTVESDPPLSAINSNNPVVPLTGVPVSYNLSTSARAMMFLCSNIQQIVVPRDTWIPKVQVIGTDIGNNSFPLVVCSADSLIAEGCISFRASWILVQENLQFSKLTNAVIKEINNVELAIRLSNFTSKPSANAIPVVLTRYQCPILNQNVPGKECLYAPSPLSFTLSLVDPGMVNCYRSPIVDQSSVTNNLCAVVEQPFTLESFADIITNETINGINAIQEGAEFVPDLIIFEFRQKFSNPELYFDCDPSAPPSECTEQNSTLKHYSPIPPQMFNWVYASRPFFLQIDPNFISMMSFGLLTIRSITIPVDLTEPFCASFSPREIEIALGSWSYNIGSSIRRSTQSRLARNNQNSGGSLLSSFGGGLFAAGGDDDNDDDDANANGSSNFGNSKTPDGFDSISDVALCYSSGSVFGEGATYAPGLHCCNLGTRQCSAVDLPSRSRTIFMEIVLYMLAFGGATYLCVLAFVRIQTFSSGDFDSSLVEEMSLSELRTRKKFGPLLIILVPLILYIFLISVSVIPEARRSNYARSVSLTIQIVFPLTIAFWFLIAFYRNFLTFCRGIRPSRPSDILFLCALLAILWESILIFFISFCWITLGVLINPTEVLTIFAAFIVVVISFMYNLRRLNELMDSVESSYRFNLLRAKRPDISADDEIVKLFLRPRSRWDTQSERNLRSLGFSEKEIENISRNIFSFDQNRIRYIFFNLISTQAILILFLSFIVIGLSSFITTGSQSLLGTGLVAFAGLASNFRSEREKDDEKTEFSSYFPENPDDSSMHSESSSVEFLPRSRSFQTAAFASRNPKGHHTPSSADSDAPEGGVNPLYSGIPIPLRSQPPPLPFPPGKNIELQGIPNRS